MDKNLKIELDKLLFECQKNGSVITPKNESNIREKAIGYGKATGLITNKHSSAIELTNEGLKVINCGGIDRYLFEITIAENEEEIIKNLTIKQLKGSIFQVRYWWLILLISGIIGFVTGNIELIIKYIK